jgi:hypothetical protein
VADDWDTWKSNLRKLAEKTAAKCQHPESSEDDFAVAVTGSALLALLDENERLRAELATEREGHKWETERADACKQLFLVEKARADGLAAELERTRAELAAQRKWRDEYRVSALEAQAELAALRAPLAGQPSSDAAQRLRALEVDPGGDDSHEACGVRFHHSSRRETSHCVAGAPGHDGPHINPYVMDDFAEIRSLIHDYQAQGDACVDRGNVAWEALDRIIEAALKASEVPVPDKTRAAANLPSCHHHRLTKRCRECADLATERERCAELKGDLDAQFEELKREREAHAATKADLVRVLLDEKSTRAELERTRAELTQLYAAFRPQNIVNPREAAQHLANLRDEGREDALTSLTRELAELEARRGAGK